MTQPVAVGVDLGGTNLRIALVDAIGDVVDRLHPPHPGGDVDLLVRTIVDATERLGTGLPVGVGVAGLVGEGRFVYGPNLPLPGVDLGAALGRALGRRVPVANDATLATLAEWRVGAAAGHDDVVMVTVGTGVGGGLVVGGRLVGGAHGFAGEIGHSVVRAGGRECACGNHGCLEAYVSGTGVARLAVDMLASGASSSLSDLDVVTGRDVQQAADAGDQFARSVLVEAGELLGAALAGVANVVDPSVIVLGGGAFVGSATLLLPAVRDVVGRSVLGAGSRPPPAIVAAHLGDDAGIVGAALLGADPSLLPGA